VTRAASSPCARRSRHGERIAASSSIASPAPPAAPRDARGDGGLLPGRHRSSPRRGPRRHGLMVGILVRRPHARLGACLHLFNVFSADRMGITVVLSTWTAFVARIADPIRLHWTESRADAALRSRAQRCRRGAISRCARQSAYLGHMWSSTRCGEDRRLPDGQLRAHLAGRHRPLRRPSSRRSPPSPAGGIGSVAAGLLADRLGRTPITIAPLMISGPAPNGRVPLRRNPRARSSRVP